KDLNELEPKIIALQGELEKPEIDEMTKLTLQRKLDLLLKEKKKWLSHIGELEKEKSIIQGMVYIPSKIVEIEGLYNVMVEYEEDVLEEERREEVRHHVVDRLMSHRNLCEDFLSVNAVE